MQLGSNQGFVRERRRTCATTGNETLLRQMLENLPAGAYTCDPTGLITFYNQQAVRIWGRAPKLNDDADRYCGSFKLFSSGGEPLDRAECWMALALREGRGYNGEEIVIERPDGARLTALAHANPYFDETGKLMGAVNVLVDVSARKQVEQALRDADRNKNEFLATLAHELRNPLAPMRNAVEFLHLKIPSSPELEWAFEVIARQMRQMTRLVDDLLDIARITNNRLELRKESTDLVTILRAAVETGKPLIEASNLNFMVSLPQTRVRLSADPVRLAQLIDNLLNNSAKYSRPGGSVWLAAERQGTDAVVTVRDDGIGIDPAALPGIFGMFSQANRSKDGLGIGLALARRLAELHGGSITAHSEGLYQGAEFRLRVPLGNASADEEAERPQPAAIRAASRLRIMVVDDNRDTADSLQMLLRMMGNDIRSAYDGGEALRIADEFRPDVMFLDIGLPRMNGCEVAQILRKREWTRELTLIAISGWGQESDRQRSQQSGFDRHLVKPVDPAAIFELLHDLHVKHSIGDSAH